MSEFDKNDKLGKRGEAVTLDYLLHGRVMPMNITTRQTSHFIVADIEQGEKPSPFQKKLQDSGGDIVELWTETDDKGNEAKRITFHEVKTEAATFGKLPTKDTATKEEFALLCPDAVCIPFGSGKLTVEIWQTGKKPWALTWQELKEMDALADSKVGWYLKYRQFMRECTEKHPQYDAMLWYYWPPAKLHPKGSKDEVELLYDVDTVDGKRPLPALLLGFNMQWYISKVDAMLDEAAKTDPTLNDILTGGANFLIPITDIAPLPDNYKNLIVWTEDGEEPEAPAENDRIKIIDGKFFKWFSMPVTRIGAVIDPNTYQWISVKNRTIEQGKAQVRETSAVIHTVTNEKQAEKLYDEWYDGLTDMEQTALTEAEYKQQIADNISTIGSIDGDAYPFLYGFLMNRKGKMLDRLVRLLEVLHETQNQTFYRERWYCFASLEYLTERGQDITKGYQAWKSTVMLLLVFGLLKRHIPSECANDMYNKYMKSSLDKSKKSKKRPISYWTVDAYTHGRLKIAEHRAKKWIQSGMTLQHFSKESITTVFGQRVADKIYSHKATISHKDREVENALVEAAIQLIHTAGYATKSMVLDAATHIMENQYPNDAERFRELDPFAALTQQAQDKPRNLRQEVAEMYSKRGKAILHKADIKLCPPTTKDMEQYHLDNRQWIFKYKKKCV